MTPIQPPPATTPAATTQPIGVTAAPIPKNARMPVGAKNVEATVADLTTATAVPAAPAAQPATETQVDPLLLKAIDENDELSYWQENSKPLWSKAIAMDSALLADPEYAKLSYSERFVKVVESVKAEVTKGATPGKLDTKVDDPPESLSGSGGIAPIPDNNDALTRVLAAPNPEAQLKIYNALPQDDKDKVDMALNI